MNKNELKLKVQLLRNKIEKAASYANDETALGMIELFPRWVENSGYSVGDRIQYESKLYKCVQRHTSQADWTPDLVPALWIQISIEEWPEWIRPLGSEDAYKINDKVSHNGKHWVSLINGNVWEPGGIGAESLWQEV